MIDLTVVIPAFGRVEPLKYTLSSVALSLRESGRRGEILVVDDGSEPALAEELRGFEIGHDVRFVRQQNQGSIVARGTGLDEAAGKYVTFVDSDDVVHPQKFAAQLTAMDESGVEISYTDRADVTLGPDYAVTSYRPSRKFEATEDSVVLFTRIAPSPHSPVYRTDYLRRALEQPKIAPRRVMDPAGDLWLFRNLALVPGSVRKVYGDYAGVGPHEETRFTGCWEKIAVASLAIDEAVMALPDQSEVATAVRRRVGQGAFHAWRVLPYDVDRGYEERLLALWRKAPAARPQELAGPVFRALAKVVGWEQAGRMMRRRLRPSYDECRTLPEARDFAQLVADLPRAGA